MPKIKRVLITPLNWGLGHATRCIPIIRVLKKHGAQVLIASDGAPLEFLKKEFPNLTFFELPSYRIDYPADGSMVFKMIFSSPRIFSAINKEHDAIEKIIEQENIDAVISDNRYGCYSQKIYSVIITHQVNIQCPYYLKWFEPALFRLNKKYISKFTRLWIPDYGGEQNLSGELSHPSNIATAEYIGPLSRFGNISWDEKEFKYDVLAICSGPEPQRTLFEEKIKSELHPSELNAAIVKGVIQDDSNRIKKNNLTIIPWLGSEEMEKIILQSKIVISRPGYSTIMDMVHLGKKAIFIPTPGQTEQEYLSKNYREKNLFYSESQSEFNLQRSLRQSEKFTGIKMEQNDALIDAAIQKLMHHISK